MFYGARWVCWHAYIKILNSVKSTFEFCFFFFFKSGIQSFPMFFFFFVYIATESICDGKDLQLVGFFYYSSVMLFMFLIFIRHRMDEQYHLFSLYYQNYSTLNLLFLLFYSIMDSKTTLNVENSIW